MASRQGDLFSGAGFAVEQRAPSAGEGAPEDWSKLDIERLIAALANADTADCLAIVAELGRRRRAVAAVPALERLCRRFAGFGLERIVPEQAAALEALAAIGGRTAAEAVARLISRSIVNGLGLNIAARAAADLGARLPPEAVLALLRHDDPEVRAAACRCLGGRCEPETIQVLVDLLDDLHASVREAAACALGHMGRTEAKDLLVRLLREKPSAPVIEAIASIADGDAVVVLGRLARERRDLRSAALDALEAIDHPRAERLAARLRDPAPAADP